MRIAFVCGGGIVGGREIVTLTLMRALAERGHTVACLTGVWGTRRFQRNLVEADIEHTALPLGFISKRLDPSAMWMTAVQLARTPELWAGYRRALRRLDPDVVVHTNYHHLTMLFPLLEPRRSCFHVHETFDDTPFYRRLVGALSRRVARVVVVSEFVAERLRGLGVAGDRIRVVRNGIEALGDDTTRSGSAQARPERVLRVGIAGQIGPWKGHEDLIDAVRILHDDGTDVECHVFGAGRPEYLAALKAHASRRGVADLVRWHGFVDDRTSIFAGLDVCAVPSRHDDPFPTVALEAAWCGVPVVATRRGGLPEIVADGETGYLVEAGRADAIASRLRVLAADVALRVRMGECAARKARAEFTVQRMVTQFEREIALAVSGEAVGHGGLS